jgi:hypothetical protein
MREMIKIRGQLGVKIPFGQIDLNLGKKEAAAEVGPAQIEIHLA